MTFGCSDGAVYELLGWLRWLVDDESSAGFSDERSFLKSYFTTRRLEIRANTSGIEADKCEHQLVVFCLQRSRACFCAEESAKARVTSLWRKSLHYLFKLNSLWFQDVGLFGTRDMDRCFHLRRIEFRIAFDLLRIQQSASRLLRSAELNRDIRRLRSFYSAVAQIGLAVGFRTFICGPGIGPGCAPFVVPVCEAESDRRIHVTPLLTEDAQDNGCEGIIAVFDPGRLSALTVLDTCLDGGFGLWSVIDPPVAREAAFWYVMWSSMPAELHARTLYALPVSPAVEVGWGRCRLTKLYPISVRIGETQQNWTTTVLNLGSVPSVNVEPTNADGQHLRTPFLWDIARGRRDWSQGGGCTYGRNYDYRLKHVTSIKRTAACARLAAQLAATPDIAITLLEVRSANRAPLVVVSAHRSSDRTRMTTVTSADRCGQFTQNEWTLLSRPLRTVRASRWSGCPV